MTDSLIEIIGDNVARVETVLLPALSSIDRGIESINYMYGPIKEINKTLTMWTTTAFKDQKYPLVALVMPFNELQGTINGVDGINDIRILICMSTDPAVLTPERIEKNFIPILRPIFWELLKQFTLDERIMDANLSLMQRTKVEWPFWDDGNDKNPFNDRLDIIEIKGLKLKIYTNC